MDASNRTFVSSVLFLDIVEYSKQSVTDQLTLKQRFNELLVEALRHVAPSDRIVLDTGDGAAISFQGNPEDSLFAAMYLRDALAALPAEQAPRLLVRFGINLGPVRLIKDVNGQINIIGDGINVAQRVMSFAEAGVILVSRSYYEVVSRLSDDYAKIFQDAGTRTDKHVREHAVYAIGKSPDGVAPPHGKTAHLPSENDSPAAGGAAPASTSGKSRKRLLLAGGAAFALASVLVGIGIRAPRNGETAGADGAPPATISAKSAVDKSTPVAGNNSKPHEKPTSGAQSPPAKPAKSVVVFAVAPWGEIYVDGKKKGVSPPLKTLSLTPGTHTIEIRNATFPAYVNVIDAKPGADTRIVHKF